MRVHFASSVAFSSAVSDDTVYGFGNSFYCNITDSAGRPIPAFGPVSLAEDENL